MDEAELFEELVEGDCESAMFDTGTNMSYKKQQKYVNSKMKTTLGSLCNCVIYLWG